MKNKHENFLKLCGNDIWVATDRLKHVWWSERVLTANVAPTNMPNIGYAHFVAVRVDITPT